jgi:iron complex outermembrane recepter protein
MSGRTATRILRVWAMILPSLASAGALEYQVRISNGPLPSGLRALQVQTGIELLYDGEVVREFQAPSVVGKFDADSALQQLLSETELTVRRAVSGAWIIERRTTPPLAQQDAAVAEILVLGRRTQNADIRRTEEDVQPYLVSTQKEIAAAHRDNVDQFFANRVTPNAQLSRLDGIQLGTSFSQIDLRGLGAYDTLVLVDGRRMPSRPDSGSGFLQADINGIPLRAIERIEVLTGAAGGIHGFGALGGVVNVVLDRDRRGLELFASGGISSRGDAGRKSIEASYGFTSDDARTSLDSFASWAETDTLLAGQRDFAERDRRLAAEQNPALFQTWGVYGDSVSVYGFDPVLEFKPEFGGGVIASDHTYLPSGFSGSADELVSSLTSHGGQFDTRLSAGGAASDLGTNPHTASLLFNVRHRFDAGLEVYADALMSRTRGQITLWNGSGQAFMSPDSPANPFTSFVQVYFPIATLANRAMTRVESSRYTAGMLAELPSDWRGTVEAGYGAFIYDQSTASDVATNNFLFLFGDPADLDTNPLGDWNSLQAAMAASTGKTWTNWTQKNRFENISMRVAGPLFSTAAGPATLTFLAEHRKERIRPNTVVGIGEIGETRFEVTETDPGRMSKTTSFYTELRAPLIPADARVPFIRGLEGQLAVRHDDQRNEFVEEIQAVGDDIVYLRPRFAATAFTAGAKITPWRWLMLRASYATGEQPLETAAFRKLADYTAPSIPATDPKRGDRGLGEDGPVVWRTGGNRDLKTSRARTASLGVVLTPLGDEGPTLAVDYSRIRKTRDLLFALSPQELLDHEDFWFARVTRAALTDEDRAAGYSAGPVTIVDTRYANGTSRVVDTFDSRADWPLPFLGGRLRFYADATYHKSNRESAPLRPSLQHAGFRDGPLKWRANGGVDWSNARLTVGANLQYFGSNRLYHDGTDSPEEVDLVVAQGSLKVPAQKYLDAYASFRIPMRAADTAGELTADLGVVNVLDTAPPRETSLFLSGPGYSEYGDGRRRRFELVLSCRF